MTLDDLTVNFAHLNRGILLSDWEWLIGKNKLPILISAGGDAFLQDTNDNTVHFLDVTAGRLTKVASTGKEFRTLLDDREFVGTHFSVQKLGELMLSDSILPKGKIYSFIDGVNRWGQTRLIVDLTRKVDSLIGNPPSLKILETERQRSEDF